MHTFATTISRIALVWLGVMLVKNSDAQGTLLKTYAADTLSFGYSIAAASGSGYVMAGQRADTLAAGAALALMKVDASGDVLWSGTWAPISVFDRPEVVALSGGGTLVLSTTHPQRDLLLLRVDDAGDTLWTRVLDHPSPMAAAAAVELPGGDVVLASYVLTHLYLTRLNTLGAPVWSQSYSGGSLNPASGHGARARISLTSDGDLIACGMMSNDVLLESNAFILKVDLSGGLIWGRFLGGDDQDGFRDVIETPDGGYLAIGYHCDSLNAPRQMMSVRFTNNGTIAWTKRYPTVDESLCRFLVNCPDGNYVIGGYAWFGGNRGLLFKINDQGDVLWSFAYGPSLNFWDALQVNDGLVLAATAGSSLSHEPAFMAQDSVGLSTCPVVHYPLTADNFFLPSSPTVGLGTGLSMIAGSIAASALPLAPTLECGSTVVPSISPGIMLEVYPNPATQWCFIRSLNGVMPVRFEVLDVHGRVVAQGALPGSGAIDLSRVRPGVYTVRAWLPGNAIVSRTLLVE